MEVYVAARDLAGVPIGTHQFIIIVISGNNFPIAKLNDKPVPSKPLGDGKIGYVIGAQNRGNLSAEFFEANDYQATLEHYEPNRKSFFKSDFDTQLSKVSFLKLSPSEGARKVLELVNNYSINQTMDKINYPKAGLGYNSNSWAQSIIKFAGGTALNNFDGLDISYNKKIPETYFHPFCPRNARPRLNK